MREPRPIEINLSRASGGGSRQAFDPRSQGYVRSRDDIPSDPAILAWDEGLRDALRELAREQPDPKVLGEVGDTLRDFMRPLGWADDERILRAATGDHPVVLTLRFAASELFILPWNLIKVGKRPLSELQHVYVRMESAGTETTPPPARPRPEGGRVLFAWSAAGGAVPQKLHREAIAGGLLPSWFDPDTDEVAHASYTRLAAALSVAEEDGRPFHALHLLAHGGSVDSSEGAVGLVLDPDREGEAPAVVSGPALRGLLTPYATHLRLVVLCACRGLDPGELGGHIGGVAQGIHEAGIEAVLAARRPLPVDSSIQWAQTLYRELAAGTPPANLDQAVARVRRDVLHLRQHGDADNLQLLARKTDGADLRPFVLRPYRGLLSFEPRHARFFFGRDDECAELLEEMRKLIERNLPRFQLVEGASGSGKSSMVMAGVVPGLLAERDVRWTYVRMVPGSRPREALAEAQARMREAGLADRSDHRFVLLVDQLEELFTHVPDDEDGPRVRDEFVRALWSIASTPGGRTHILCTVRADFRGRCGEVHLEDDLRLDRLFRPEMAVHHVFVPQMDREQLRQTIVRPAQSVGLRLADGLVDRMLDEVGGVPAALPLLQYTLDQVWKDRTDRLLTHESYNDLGGVAGALQLRADTVIDGLATKERALAEQLFVRLVGTGRRRVHDTRSRIPEDELRPGDERDDRFERVVAQLVDERLVVRAVTGEGPTLEVAHEALIRRWTKLEEWIARHSERIAQIDRVQTLVEQCREYDTPLIGDQLGYARDVAQRYGAEVGEEARQVIERSEAALRREEEEERAEQEQRRMEREARARAERNAVIFQKREAEIQTKRAAAAQQRAQWTTIVGFAVLVVIVILMVITLGALEEGKRNADAAEDSFKAADAAWSEVEAARTAQQRALDEAHDNAWMAAARRFEGRPFYQIPLLREVRHPRSMRDWRQLALGALRTPIPAVLDFGEGPIEEVEFTADGNRVVTRTGGGHVAVWPVEGYGEPWILDTGEDAGALADSTDLVGIAWYLEEETQVARIDGDVQLNLRHGTDEKRSMLRKVLFHPDGTRVVTVDWRGHARLWLTGSPVEPRMVRNQYSGLTQARLSPDGTRVIQLFADGRAQQRRSEEGAAAETLTGPHDRARRAAFSDDGRRIALLLDQSIVVHSLDSQSPALSLATSEQSVRIEDLFFGKDGSVNAVDLNGRTWAWLATPEGRYVPAFDDGEASHGPSVAVTGTSCARTGGLCAGLSEEGALFVWDTLAGREDRLEMSSRASSAQEGSRAVRIAPDGAHMATVGADGDAWLWDLDGTFHSQRLGGEADRALALAFSSDGRWLITGHEDATAKVWAVDDPTDVTVLEGHVGAVIDVAFSGTGAEAVCTSNDHNVRVWTLSHEALLDALWAATPHCPLPSWRGAELGEEPAEANQGHERCQKAVDERAPLAVQR